MIVSQDPFTRVITCPVYGASADIAPGTLMIRGVTGETDLGVLINGTTTSNADAIGILTELHDYSESGDALVDGSVDWFAPYKVPAPSHKVQLVDTAVLAKVDFDIGTSMAIASMTSTTKPRITSIEDGLDTGFLYVLSGTGIGQTGFIKADDATDLTLTSAPTTGWVAADTLMKILPLFHYLVYWTVGTTTVGTKIGTTAAAGSGRALVLDRHIVRNGLDEQMNPVAHHNLQGLNSLSLLNFYALVALQDTGFHPID